MKCPHLSSSRISEMFSLFRLQSPSAARTYMHTDRDRQRQLGLCKEEHNYKALFRMINSLIAVLLCTTLPPYKGLSRLTTQKCWGSNNSHAAKHLTQKHSCVLFSPCQTLNAVYFCHLGHQDVAWGQLGHMALMLMFYWDVALMLKFYWDVALMLMFYWDVALMLTF
jgi:hypothetical protein